MRVIFAGIKSSKPFEESVEQLDRLFFEYVIVNSQFVRGYWKKRMSHVAVYSTGESVE